MVPHQTARAIIPAIALLAIAFVLTACGARSASPIATARPSIRPAPSASASVEPSPSASASPSAAAATSCNELDVDATITRWEGAAGSRTATIDVKNKTGDPCRLGAPMTEKLIDGIGAPLITSTGDKAVGSDVTLAADQTAELLVRVANWCSTKPSDPVSIGLTLSGGASFVAEPGSGVTFDPPPCNGAGQPTTVEAQSGGWTYATAFARPIGLSPLRAAA